MSQARQRTKIESVPLLSGLCTLSGGDTAQPQGGSVQRAGASRWGTLRASWGITAPQEPPQRGGELSKVSHRPRTPPHGALGAPRAPPRQQRPVGAERGAVSAGKVMSPRAEALEWPRAGAGQRPGVAPGPAPSGLAEIQASFLGPQVTALALASQWPDAAKPFPLASLPAEEGPLTMKSWEVQLPLPPEPREPQQPVEWPLVGGGGGGQAGRPPLPSV